jgi:hypothetical protein
MIMSREGEFYVDEELGGTAGKEMGIEYLADEIFGRFGRLRIVDPL